VVATWLAKRLADTSNRYSYRIVFVPATIGAIAWLALNEKSLASIRHGLVLTGIGDSGSMTYKRSRRDCAEIDRATINVLEHSTSPYEIRKYEPFGYDERQYCSPGIDLPMGCLMRSPNGEYPEYHTSGDNLDFIQADSLADSLDTTMKILSVLEANFRYVNQNPMCEPQLGRRGLYRSFGKLKDGGNAQRAVQWVLNYSDGRHSLLDIAERANLPFDHMRRAADVLIEHQLLREAKVDAGGTE
jgi:aminopeptidase-like protein